MAKTVSSEFVDRGYVVVDETGAIQSVMTGTRENVEIQIAHLNDLFQEKYRIKGLSIPVVKIS